MAVFRTSPLNFPASLLARWARSVKSLVLPGRCLACGAYVGTLWGQDSLAACFCPACLGPGLPRFTRPFCTCCGQLFPRRDQDNHLCESCLRSRPALGKVRAAFAYEGVVRTAVTQLKYRGRIRLASPLEQALFDSFLAYFSQDDIHTILPVPLHPARLWTRQFNQAHLLVRHFPRLFSRRLGRKPRWTVAGDVLRRCRATVAQAGLDQKARERNLRGAFSVTRPARVRGRHLLLVDDVYTSGATCRAAAKTLLRAGARRVDALVLARA